MPQKKKQFRFKIPWISRSHAPTQRPKSPPATTEAEGTPRAEQAQQHPPSRSPAAQSPTSCAVLESLVPSPSSQSPSQPSTPTSVNSPSSSPSHTAQTPFHDAGSPSHLPSGHNTEVPPQPAVEEITHPAAPSTSEQEKEKMNSTTTSPESETSPFVPSSSIPKTQVSSPSHHENGSDEPLKVKPKELELESTQGKTHQLDDAKEIVLMEHERIKTVKGNANDIKHGESIPRSKTTAPMQTKDASTRAFRADHRKQKEARQSVERKMMFATSSSTTGKDIKVVSSSSDPATRNVTSTGTIISPKIPPQPNNEDHIPLQIGIKDEISNFVKKVVSATPTQPMDDNNFSVVTLAGENRGATMHVGSSSAKKEWPIHIHRAYKNKTGPKEQSTDEVTTDAEENSPRSSVEEEQVGKAYVNSNIQSLNNSLMLHGSVSERDPGVRVVLPQQQQQAEPIKKPLETRRAEVNVNRAEKTGYQPVIRRRCLRGMFLEPSDDELDNPDKPRRHGCKVRCGDKGSEIM